MSASQHAPPPAGMHPRHPGVGSSTTLVRLESDAPERGGVLVFFPSGRHMTVRWTSAQQINPTKEAALKYAGQLVEDLNKIAAQGKPEDRQAAEQDLARTNWVSVTAAIQRCILDFNSALSDRVNMKWAQEFGAPIRKQ